MTPKRLAANAANAQKSTGPRTDRGKVISSLNGQKGGRPLRPGGLAYLFRECQEAGRVWGMDDPGYLKLFLDGLKKNLSPNAYAIILQTHPEYEEILNRGQRDCAQELGVLKGDEGSAGL